MQPLIRRFDGHVDGGVRQVVDTAEALCIRETEVFRHAYRCWHGRELSDAVLERVFADYLIRQDVPAWVRHYCRRVLNLHAVGQLDPRDFGVDRPTMLRMTVREQVFAGMVTLVVLLLYLLLWA